MQIQVETTGKLADDEQREEVQVRELALHVEQLVEAIDMEIEQELEDQDINLMPRAYELIP